MVSPSRITTLAGNLAAVDRAEKARSALEQAGIPSIFLKGAAYLDTLYDIGARPMSDVDLLVPGHDRESARDVLMAAGFEARQPATPRRQHSFERHYNWPFVHPGPIPVWIEMHVGLCQPGRYPIDYDGIWRRRVVHRARGRRIPALCAEDAVLHVVLHDAKHWYTTPRARRAEDLTRVIDVWKPSWQDVVERARQWGVETCAYVTLGMAARDSERIPRWLVDDLAPGFVRRTLVSGLLDVRRGTPRVDTTRRPGQLAVTVATDPAWHLLRFLATYAAKRYRDLQGAP